MDRRRGGTTTRDAVRGVALLVGIAVGVAVVAAFIASVLTLLMA